MSDDQGEKEIPDDKVYHPITLTTSTQAVYGMDRLRKNRKRDYSYRLAAVIRHTVTKVPLKQGLEQFKEKG